VKLPITDSDTLTATTSPTCTASSAREANNELGVLVSAQNAGTCQVRVDVVNGGIYTFSVEFQSRDCACGGTTINAVDASAPQLISTGYLAPTPAMDAPASVARTGSRAARSSAS
jgi:hypothetical protein